MHIPWWVAYFTFPVQLLSKSVLKSAAQVTDCFHPVTTSVRPVSASLLATGFCFLLSDPVFSSGFFQTSHFCLALFFSRGSIPTILKKKKKGKILCA